MTATGQTALPAGRSWSDLLIGLCYGLFSFVIIASCELLIWSPLMAALVCKRFVANGNGATKTYLDKCEGPLIRQLAPRAIYIEDDMQGALHSLQCEGGLL